MKDRISTGLDALDRELAGGFLPGSIVVIAAPPESQSEPLLHAAMSGRPAQYLTTIRTASVVEAALDRAMAIDDHYEILHVGVEDSLESARQQLSVEREGTVVVFDTIGPIERDADEESYVAFLNELKEGLLETGSVAIFHVVDAADTPRLRSRTTEFADVVMELDLASEGVQVDKFLTIPKVRGGDPPEERIKLELGRGVDVDTSRDIA